MKGRISALICTAALMFTVGCPISAYADSNSSVSEEKIVSQDANPNTGAMTLGMVSVALAGAVVVVFKKRK